MKQLGIILAFAFLFSCNKSQDIIQVDIVETGTNHILRSICFVDDSIGYIVGGALYDEGILLKTIDRGNSWKLINNSLNGGAFGINFTDEKHGLVSAWPSRIYRTDDGGNTFQLFDGILDNIMRTPVFIDSLKCIAGSGIGFESGFLWRSADGGKSWTSDTFNRSINAVVMQNEKDGFIASYGLIFKTSDGGKTWISTDSKGDNWMNVSFPSYNTGFAVGYEGKIIKTTNHGDSWTTLVGGNNIISNSGQWTNARFVSENRGYLIGFDGNMKYTNDGGFSWTNIDLFEKNNLRDIWMFNKSEGIIIGDMGKVYKVQFNL